MNEKEIIDIIVRHYPDTQAVYLFGSYGTEYERTDSDLDIAVLLPAETAKREGLMALSPCVQELGSVTGKTVDLINLRQVSTVFRHEIINKGKRIFCGDEYATDTFEMLTMSLYQKLNYERAEIMQEFLRTRRAYNV